ncbi:MAG: hypothetical protein ABI273_14915 [Lacunisphaera sp.]
MAPRSFIIVLVSASLAIQVWGADAAAAPAKMDLSGLVNNSPFGTLRSGGAGSNAATEPFEFRAVLGENDNKFLFSIYETATRRSNWVELNDPVNGFSVKSYDAGKQAITVDYQGKAMTLAIKQAPAAAIVYQAPAPQTGPMPILQSPGNSVQPVPTMPTAIDQQRIQQIQEEIRRRRALRNQAMEPNPNPQGVQPHYGEGPRPQPSNSPGPQPIPQRN